MEFVVYGIPVSQQARRKERVRDWRARVRAAAEANLTQGGNPTQESVTLTIIYFFDSIDLDVDNLVKPIQDALEGLVYENDAQVVESRSLKRNIRGSYNLDIISPVLAGALTTGREFIYVRIERTTNLGELGL